MFYPSRNPSLMRAGFHGEMLRNMAHIYSRKCRNPSLMRAGFHTLSKAIDSDLVSILKVSQSLVNEGRFPRVMTRKKLITKLAKVAIPR